VAGGARILFAWELGGNLGHIAPMLALAKELRAARKRAEKIAHRHKRKADDSARVIERIEALV
jgi:UDP:flavonoid glycosyltransferase YjiC (YdhE family)